MKRVIIKSNEDARAYLVGVAGETLNEIEPGILQLDCVCPRCGGSGSYSFCPAYGSMCFECKAQPERMRWTERVNLIEYARKTRKRNRAQGRAQEKRVEAATKAQNKARATTVAFLAEHNLCGVLGIDALEKIEGQRAHGFLSGLRRKVGDFGSLSTAQIDAARKAYADAVQAIEDEEKKIAAPEGRQEVQGEIVSVKESAGNYGISTRMTLKIIDADGGWWLANGTVPASLWDAQDDTHTVNTGTLVSLTATVERSDSDSSFAFLKRPTKATFKD